MMSSIVKEEDLLFVSLTVENIVFVSRPDDIVDTTATAVDVIVPLASDTAWPPVDTDSWRMTTKSFRAVLVLRLGGSDWD